MAKQGDIKTINGVPHTYVNGQWVAVGEMGATGGGLTGGYVGTGQAGAIGGILGVTGPTTSAAGKAAIDRLQNQKDREACNAAGGFYTLGGECLSGQEAEDRVNEILNNPDAPDVLKDTAEKWQERNAKETEDVATETEDQIEDGINVSDLIKTHGQEAVDAIFDKAGEAIDIIKKTAKDPQAAIDSFIGTFGKNTKTGTWKDWTDVGIWGGILGIPLPPGFMGKSVRDIEEGLKKIGKTINDLITKPAETIGELVKDAKDAITGVFTKGADPAGIYDFVSGIFGGAISGIIMNEIGDTLDDLLFGEDKKPDCTNPTDFNNNKDYCLDQGFVNCDELTGPGGTELTGGIVKGVSNCSEVGQVDDDTTEETDIVTGISEDICEEKGMIFDKSGTDDRRDADGCIPKGFVVTEDTTDNSEITGGPTPEEICEAKGMIFDKAGTDDRRDADGCIPTGFTTEGGDDNTVITGDAKKCEDPNALNTGEEGDCKYPSGDGKKCEDPDALNTGEEGDCKYPSSDTFNESAGSQYSCDDPNATTRPDGSCGPCKAGYVFDGAVERCVQEEIKVTGTTLPPPTTTPPPPPPPPETTPPPETGGGGGGGGGIGMMTQQIDPFAFDIAGDPQLLAKLEFPVVDYLAQILPADVQQNVMKGLFEGMV